MFFNKKRKVTLSASTSAACDLSRKILEFIFEKRNFSLIDTTLVFLNISNKKEDPRLEVNLVTKIFYNEGFMPGKIEIKFLLNKKHYLKQTWQLEPRSEIKVNFIGETPLYLVYNYETFGVSQESHGGSAPKEKMGVFKEMQKMAEVINF